MSGDDPRLVSRRRFVKGTVASGTLIGSGLLQIHCGNQVEPAPILLAAVNADGKVAIEVSRYPDLYKPGGAVTLVFDLPEDTLYQSARAGILLVHRGSSENPPEFIATQSACPHAGCPLGYNAGTALIECPCHSSRFRATTDRDDPLLCIGKVIHLPARQDLTVFRVEYTAATQIATVDLTRELPCGGPVVPPVVDGKVVFPLIDFPDLANPGGFIVGQPEGLADSIIVVRVDSTRVVATTSICTHLRCDIGVAPGGNGFECPCHGSRYTFDGVVTLGPALRNLKTYTVTLDATSITVFVV